jgi:hypothetical protein
MLVTFISRFLLELLGTRVFPPEVRLVRGCLIGYLSKEHPSLKEACKTITAVISSGQLTLKEVLKIIDDIEKDPLCLPYIPKTEKKRKLKQLRKLLANIA